LINVGLIKKNIRGHEHRIRKEAVIRGNSLGNLILIGMAALQEADRSDVVEVPGEFGNLRHIRLHPKNRFVGIDAKGKHVDNCIPGISGEFAAVGNGREAVHVRAKAEELALTLCQHHRLDHAPIIADMQGTGRLYSRKNSHR
jgi:hypothetical protein